MKQSLLTIFALGLLITSCQTEDPCVKNLKKTINPTNLYSDSSLAIIKDCGNLEAVDIEISRTPLFAEIVNLKEFSDGKYNVQRFVTDFEKFSKTAKYDQLKTTLILRDKKYNEAEWSADKAKLIKQYNLNDEDAALLESVIKNPANKEMNFTDAYKEMSNLKVQKIIEQAKKMQGAQ